MGTRWLDALVPVMAAVGLCAAGLLLLATGASARAQTPLFGAAETPIRGPITVTLAADLAWFVPLGWQATVAAEKPGAASERTPRETLLSAWQGAPRFEDAEVRLTMTRTSRDKLGLAAYVAAAARGLAAKGYTVTETAITTSVRADGLPAATLAFGTTRAQGYQVVVYDDTGEHLLIMTLAAPAVEYETARADLLATIARTTHE